MLKNKAWIVDIDGTLALMNGRGPFDWSRVGEDLPNEPVVRLVHAIDLLGDAVIFMSGRMEQARFQTEMWLAAQIGFSGPLFMRADEDYRPDTVVKRELFDNHVKGRYDVIGVIDDRSKVVRMWRELGLVVLDVAGNDF